MGVIKEGISKLLTALKFDGLAVAAGAEPADIGRLDAAFLKVAMLVSALDGNVTGDELAAFERLAKECRGYNAESSRKIFTDGIRAAGYIELYSRFASVEDRLEAFTEEAFAILPGSFVGGGDADIRRAFVMWTAMAMSDGDYSDVERRAIAALAQEVGVRIEALVASDGSLAYGYSPAFAIAYAKGATRRAGTCFTKDFLARAEALVGKLEGAETSEAAARELRDLIVNG